jgi:hypothetical protein
MGILKSLSSWLSGPAYEKPLYYFSVKCNRCGEVIQGRVDLHNDISLNDDGNGYHCTKVLIGEASNLCFNKIQVILDFDAKRRVTNREITGGVFDDD